MDSSERWSRIQSVLEVYFEALEHGRKPELESLCGGDRKLFEEVQAIVASDSGTVGLLAELEKNRVADELPMPAKIGPFRTIAPIGRGGMGRVYLAQESRTDRFVAVKVLASNAGATDRARFLREGKTIAMIEHKNIVPIYSVGDEADQPYIAMKWLSGPALDSVGAPMDPKKAATIGVAVARALDFAHRNGVIHRDVKPANIILDTDTPYVVDFGLARCETDVTLTRQNAVPGTLLYIAPENLRGDRPSFDPRIDLYGLGAVLYEIIAGRPIFELDEIEPLVRRIVAEDPAPLELRGPDRDLETIIFRALDKDPERRFQTGEAMAQDLERWLDGRPIVSRRIGVFGRVARWARRRPRLAAASVFVFVATAVIAAVGIEKVRDERRVFSENIRSVESLIEQRKTRAARIILKTLERGRSADDEISRLIRCAEVVDQVEDLADILFSRRESEDIEMIRRTFKNIDFASVPDSLEHWAFGIRVLANYVAGDVDAARRDLAAWRTEIGTRDSRGRAAMAMLVDGTLARSAAAIGGESGDCDDHMIVALALYHAGCSDADVTAELDAARQIDPTNMRIDLLESFVILAAGDPMRALGRFEMIRRSERINRVLPRVLAAIYLQVGDTEKARHEMSAVPDEGMTVLDVHLAVESAFREGRIEDVRKILGPSGDGARFAAHPHILFCRSVLALMDRRFDDALELARQSLSVARYRPYREQAESQIFAIEALRRLPDDQPMRRISDRSEAAVAEVERLIKDGRTLAPTFTSNEAASRVLIAVGRLLIGVGRDAEAFDTFTSAIEENPDDPTAHFFRGTTGYSFVEGQRASADWNYARAGATIESLWRVVELQQAGRVAVSKSVAASALTMWCFLMRSFGDKNGARRGLDALRKLAETLNLIEPAKRAVLEDIEDWADR